MLGLENIPPWAKYLPTVTAAVYGWFATFHSDKLHETSVGGKKTISRTGWVGIAVLVLGVLAGVASAVRDDQETASSREKLANDMQAALGKLQIIGKDLSKTSLGVAASAASAQKSASALGLLVSDVNADVETTSQLLRESKMPVSAYNLRVIVAFDVVAFDDQLNRSLLMPDQRAALEGKAPLSSADQISIVAALNEHRRQVLEALFRRWEMAFHLMKRAETKERGQVGRPVFAQDLTFPGDEGASTYFTLPDSRIRTPQGRIAAGCVLRYTVPLAGIPGLRTFKDLNGAEVFFSLNAVPGVIGLSGAFAYLGFGGSGAYRKRDELAIYLPEHGIEWKGHWEYSARIPLDKYQMP